MGTFREDNEFGRPIRLSSMDPGTEGDGRALGGTLYAPFPHPHPIYPFSAADRLSGRKLAGKGRSQMKTYDSVFGRYLMKVTETRKKGGEQGLASRFAEEGRRRFNQGPPRGPTPATRLRQMRYQGPLSKWTREYANQSLANDRIMVGCREPAVDIGDSFFLPISAAIITLSS
ncbi:hypothetical protein CEXT_594091 [Caerostris extrusa]|uniref:Uncharacterized protein n=1 Tax=Caerostris extrusa TaxID=172846 RepID=A0AAV4T1Z4_CAEEX|nr:hypothetical protein CEXT_594091 [Caerostris extrusa]